MEDVPLLLQHFLERYAREFGKTIDGVASQAMDKILAYDFPGNVRELENMVERAVALARGPRVDPESLPPAILAGRSRTSAARLPLEGTNLDELVNRFEGDLLREALARTGGVKKRAAQLLGISFRSLRYRLEKLGIEGLGPDDE
jgi:two-component system response regulator PilR (NtrC family)